jgi:1-acyl-sn-glycerol-3-phosphate acyltransferase
MTPGDLGLRDPAYVARVAPRLRSILRAYFRTRVEGMHLLPDRPFLGVGTHNGSVLMPDMFVWMAEYAALDRRPPMVVLAHDLIFDGYPRPLSRALARLGGVRADPSIAERALHEGHAVQVYPGGDFDAEKPFSQRHRVVFAGRTGYARLALRANVPIVPIVSVGAHETLIVITDGAKLAKFLRLPERIRLQVLPFGFCLPWGIFIGPPPGFLPLPAQITLRVLDAIEPEGDAGDEDAVLELDRRVRAAMQSGLDDLSRDRIPWIGAA